MGSSTGTNSNICSLKRWLYHNYYSKAHIYCTHRHCEGPCIIIFYSSFVRFAPSRPNFCTRLHRSEIHGFWRSPQSISLRLFLWWDTVKFKSIQTTNMTFTRSAFATTFLNSKLWEKPASLKSIMHCTMKLVQNYNVTRKSRFSQAHEMLMKIIAMEVAHIAKTLTGTHLSR